MQAIESSASTTCCLLDEAAFREVIIRERKRSERSGRAVVLLLASVRDTADEDREGALLAGATVFADRKVESGTLGWVEAGRTVGLLVPEIDPVPTSAI